MMGSRSSTAVYVYRGEGSFKNSRRLLLQTLQKVVDPSHHSVEYITPEQIKEGSWIKNCKLIALGGGYDLGFEAALGKVGTRHIREFVLSGGSYLGLCAGAYWASDHIEFDKGGPLEVVGERFLKFYPGLCIGPAFPGFDYDSSKGVCAVPVVYKEAEILDTFMEGGGYFVPYDSSDRGAVQSDVNLVKLEIPSHLPIQTSDSLNGFSSISRLVNSSTHIHGSAKIGSSLSEQTEVLGTFQSLPNYPAAVVKCHVGNGLAILSAVHLEFSAHSLDNEDPWVKAWMPKFLESENKRSLVFKDILQQLGVKCIERPESLWEQDLTDFYYKSPRPTWIYV